MSDIKLFKGSTGVVDELVSISAPLEKSLQSFFERNLEKLLGVRFLASEYITTNGGRMDTLGLDENGYPVIIEYKRDKSDNVINQGLFYLDWLMDHKASLELLVRDNLESKAASSIEWSAPRLICIAANFSKYDEHAVKQMGRNIELIRYQAFGEDLLLLERLTEVVTNSSSPQSVLTSGKPGKYKTNSQSLADASEELKNLYADVENFLNGLGDDVVQKTLKNYFAYKRIKNFACVEVKPTLNKLLVYLKVTPSKVNLVKGFSRDVSNIGHFGTGDLEITIKKYDDLEQAKQYIQQAYDAS